MKDLAQATESFVLAVEKATRDDIDFLMELRAHTSQWLLGEKGIQQWFGAHPRSSYEREIQSGDLYVIRGENQIIATITLDQRANPVWKERVKDQALSIHRLMVVRNYLGRGLGKQFLHWAEEEARKRGIPFLRLDCDAINPGLCRYYRERGFQSCGVVEDKNYDMTLELFEKATGLG